MLRCDHGTENCLLTTAQISFRMFHEDSLAAEKSVVYGASTSNTVCMTITDLLMMLIYCIVSELKVGGLSCEGPKHTGGLTVSE